MSFSSNIFSKEQPLCAELYVFTFSNGTTLRFTSFDRDLAGPEVYDGNAYTHIPIKRGAIESDSDLSSNQLTVSGPRYYFSAIDLTSDGFVQLSITKCFLPDKTYMNIFSGQVLAIKKTLGEAQLTCESIFYHLGRRIPHVFFQSACNNTLFDTFCKLVPASFTTSSAGNIRANGYGKNVIFTMASLITTVNSITIPQGDTAGSDGALVKNFWTYGRITIGGETRTITSCNPSGDLVGVTGSDLDGWGVVYNLARNPDESDNDYRARLVAIGKRTVFFHYPFSTFTNPVTVSLLPGCDKSAAFCVDVFDNLINFTGFPYFPASDPTVLPVSAAG